MLTNQQYILYIIYTKLYMKNLYDPKILDEFDYGSNWTQAT